VVTRTVGTPSAVGGRVLDGDGDVLGASDTAADGEPGEIVGVPSVVRSTSGGTWSSVSDRVEPGTRRAIR
jgi:hypothetical protein